MIVMKIADDFVGAALAAMHFCFAAKAAPTF